MNESDWVKLIGEQIHAWCTEQSPRVEVHIAKRLAYGFEILEYNARSNKPKPKTREYQTDLLITEMSDDAKWKPRIVIECKINTINTHDSITYSQKAASHKSVHPFLRYGIILGNRGNAPLPGRLCRHGSCFDFMTSFSSFELEKVELSDFQTLLALELDASRALERIVYDSHKKSGPQFKTLHRRLFVR